MSTQWWKSKPWRMIQTNMREIDLEHLDARKYVEQIRAFHANIAMISIGGIQANYPTKLADHPINPHLSGDSLATVVDLCHQNGIRVIGRTDYSKIRPEVFERHPDWAYRDPQGRIVNYNGNIHACPCGGFQQEKAFEITEEILRTFPLDGIFVNMGGFGTRDYSYHYHGICHCRACQEGFMKRFGQGLPDREDETDPVYRRYQIFQQEVLADQNRRMAELIHRIRPETAFQGVDFMRVESNTEYRRRQWLYNSSSAVRVCQTVADVPCSNPTVDFIGYSYRHVAVSPHQQKLRMYQTLANLGRLDYYIMGMLHNHEDRSGYDAVKEVFRFHESHENLYQGMHLIGDALVVHTAGYGVSEEGRGWIRALSESHIPFHECDPEMLRDADLILYKAVILADQRKIDGDIAAKLDAYAQDGGCLIVCGMSGIYDQNGEERRTLPFASLENTTIDAADEDMLSAMFHLRPVEHKLFPEMADSEMFFFGETYIHAHTDGGRRILKLIPPHRFGPPELCYYTEVSEEPGLTLHSYGEGTA